MYKKLHFVQHTETKKHYLSIILEDNKEVVLKHNIGMHAWHSSHHYAHIENLLKREGWK